ncbi:hypothetical protein RJ641_004098 [Dillenia turbinata]|uniref:glucose-1-phosphate adenylyltransferase n=1 Tax=Dillenia turbinata TaxID=194707 RepID=A0AAN8VE41_9MAGN
MAFPADGRISPFVAGRLRGHNGLVGQNLGLAKFGSGELMGKMLKMANFRQGTNATKNARLHVSMTITTNVAGEAKWDQQGLHSLTHSASLNRHLARAYNLGGGFTFGDGFVEVLAATQTPVDLGKRLFRALQMLSDNLIGYLRMGYMDFVHSRLRFLSNEDRQQRVLSFSEKPQGDDLKAVAVDTTVLGLSPDEAEKKPYIASMGVYVFALWRFPTANDFGSEIIPASAKEFYIKANLALTADPPRFSFYDATKPMYASRRNLPPSKIEKSKEVKIVDSIISHGSFLDHCFIEHSVVGIRSQIGSNVHLKDKVMFGADYYKTEEELASLLAKGRVPIGIGENTKIQGCIVDKNARIGKNVVIANSEGVQEADTSEGFYIRSRVTIILKNSTINEGTVIQKQDYIPLLKNLFLA